MVFGIDDAIIAAGITAAGAGIAGSMSMSGTHSQNKANRRMAREQMAFQERMSNTSYQRARRDMEAAGLNPALMYGAHGASTPSGAMATQENALGRGVSSAMEAVSKSNESKLARAEVENKKAQNENIREQTQLTKLLEKEKLQDIIVKSASAQQIMLENQVKQIDTDFWNTPPGTILRYVKNAMGAISPFADTVNTSQQAMHGIRNLLK